MQLATLLEELLILHVFWVLQSYFMQDGMRCCSPFPPHSVDSYYQPLFILCNSHLDAAHDSLFCTVIPKAHMLGQSVSRHGYMSLLNCWAVPWRLGLQSCCMVLDQIGHVFMTTLQRGQRP